MSAKDHLGPQFGKDSLGRTTVHEGGKYLGHVAKQEKGWHAYLHDSSRDTHRHLMGEFRTRHEAAGELSIMKED